MLPEKIGGIMPAAVTVWGKDEAYDKKNMEKYVRWLIDNGAHGLSICGTTGENIAMSFDEQKEIITHVLGYVAGEVPVYCGTGRYATCHTIEISKHAEKCGADGVMIILPYYLHPYKRAVLEHFRSVRKNIGIDIMVYNNPWFAGYELTPYEIKTLFDEKVIGSVKAAQGDVNRVHELKFVCGDNIRVFYGHDYGAMEAFFARADGWLSGLPAVLPKQCRKLYDICTVEKDVKKANEYLYKLMPMIQYLMYDKKNEEPYFHEIFKYVLKLQGIEAGLPRRPQLGLDDANKRKIEKIMAEIPQ